MNFRITLVISSLITSVFLWGQNIRIEGVVLDSLGSVIPTANVVATNLETSKLFPLLGSRWAMFLLICSVQKVSGGMGTLRDGKALNCHTF